MSGHITMSARTNKFYQGMILNDQRRILEHEAGLGQKQSRNDPILCTRSPREKVGEFNFTPPPATHDDKYSKWKFPEVDEGIMSQLPSQKAKFEKIRQKELEYKKYMELNSIKKKSISTTNNESARKLESETKDETNNNNNNNTSRSSPITNTSRSQNPSNDNDNNDTSRTSSTSRTGTARVHSGRTTGRTTDRSILRKIDEDTDCYHQRVTDFKKTLNNNPAMLKVYRAKRAADFIEKQTSKLQSPVMYEDAQTQRNKSTSTLSANPDMNTLLNELKATEDQIQNLKLKVGLKAKTKGYERPTTHTSMRRPSI